MAFSIGLSSVTAFAVEGSRGVEAVGPRGETRQLYSGSYALLIGASDYTHGWQPLPSIPFELEDVDKALREQGFETRVVLDPTSEVLKREVHRFINQRTQPQSKAGENRVLIYFSGHGHTRHLARGERRGYLVPVDAPLPAQDEGKFLERALAMGQFATWAKEIESKHALFVFDSCFSGTIVDSRGSQPVPRHIGYYVDHAVRQYITAGSADQTVPAKSHFTPAFVRGIQGAADHDSDGYVTGGELGSFLQRSIANIPDLDQMPQVGQLQTGHGAESGDFVFRADPSAEPVRLAPPAAKPRSRGSDLALEVMPATPPPKRRRKPAPPRLEPEREEEPVERPTERQELQRPIERPDPGPCRLVVSTKSGASARLLRFAGSGSVATTLRDGETVTVLTSKVVASTKWLHVEAREGRAVGWLKSKDVEQEGNC